MRVPMYAYAALATTALPVAGVVTWACVCTGFKLSIDFHTFSCYWRRASHSELATPAAASRTAASRAATPLLPAVLATRSWADAAAGAGAGAGACAPALAPVPAAAAAAAAAAPPFGASLLRLTSYGERTSSRGLWPLYKPVFRSQSGSRLSADRERTTCHGRCHPRQDRMMWHAVVTSFARAYVPRVLAPRIHVRSPHDLRASQRLLRANQRLVQALRPGKGGGRMHKHT